MEENIQHYRASREPKAAIALVIHGLNVRPEAMLPLIRFLNGYGTDAYLVRLAGHRTGEKSMEGPTAAAWPEEIAAGYRLARKAADAHSVPLYFLGFSLGALLGQALPASGNRFDKQVLLAPATALRRRCYLLRAVFFLGKKTKLPSLTPVAYRSHPATPVEFYQALFAAEKKLLASGFCHQHLPTLILLDPKDELISYQKLLRQVRAYRLSGYEVVTLNPRLKGRTTIHHHLILDEGSMGKENWQLATQKIAAFLFGRE